MKTYIQRGEVIDATANYTGSAGAGMLIGTLFGVAQEDFVNNNPVSLVTEGVVEIAKTSALQIDVGDRVFWDNAAKVVNKTAAAQVCVGIAVSQSLNPSPTVRIKLGANTPAGT